jgi:metallophosphoesterase (TIGR03767 family)
MRGAALTVALALALAAAPASTAASASDPFGLSTVTQRIVPDGAPGFDQLGVGPGEGYAVREDGFGAAQPGRAGRRISLAYFGQLSDFQLADEESPARVEFADLAGSPVEAAYRPWEALEPFIDDAMIRQIDAFAGASPVASGDGSRSAMNFAIDTGDSADNQQFNETQWVRTLLEGGTLDPNSGIDPSGYSHPLCPALGVPGAAEAARYTGVQDYGDYVEGPSPYFYDPDEPRGAAAAWPEYPGLMDRAQQPFTATGLTVPSYLTFGNHDALAQGNQAANAGFEQVATGCIKPMAGVPGELEGLSDLTPAALLGLLTSDPTATTLVPPDPDRRYVSKAQYKRVFREGSQADGHGFGDVDPAEETASNGTAGYYSFVPVPGLRMIALDTICEGGVTGPCADGNVDDPQFRWLEGELQEATAADQLVVIFSHHAIPSLTANVPDEAAPACTAPDAHGHDVNPGCDADPRLSTPIHLGADMVALLHRYPHVIAWVAGHSHVNDVTPYPDGNGHGFWSIRVAAEADWPQQSRLLQVFDNRDGTLSLFGTILDHASGATAPAAGTAASGLGTADLASIGRTLSYNDAQTGGRACTPEPCGEGGPGDRNVELLVADPRRGSGAGGSAGAGNGGDRGGGGAGAGGPCSNRISGTRRRETLRGTAGSDLLLGRGGRDQIRPRGGADCVFAGRGNDRVYARSGPRRPDRRDHRRDRPRGSDRRDLDVVRCGRGRHDVAYLDRRDRAKGCERVLRPKRR